MATASQRVHEPGDDERRLAELGYKQELKRKWSGFSNFAISFSIISILAGCFTTFGQAWNNGGPIAISWGWPLISIFILLIGFAMSELVSAYPTAGGIYWWASKMGSPLTGYITGWLNLVGLIAVTASVDYGCATFLNLTMANMIGGWEGHAEPGVPAVRHHPGAARVDQHLRPADHPPAAERLGVVARVRRGRDRADPDVRPGQPPERVLGVRRAAEQLRLRRRRHRRRDVLALRAAAGLPAHPVHDHRVRRVRPRVRGDQGRVAGGGQRPLAVDRVLGDRRLDPAAGVAVRRHRRRGHQRRRPASRELSWRPRSRPASSRPSSSSRRSASSSAA